MGEEEPEASASGSSPWRFSAAGGPTISCAFLQSVIKLY